MISSHKDLARKPAELEKKYDGQFHIVFEAIQQLIEVEEMPKEIFRFITGTLGNERRSGESENVNKE